PLILGHADSQVIDAICRAAADGATFGASTAGEVELAEMIVDAVSSIEMVRLVNSGTEAVMSAIRLARGYTGRSKIIKCEGCYHGHSDGLLAKAGSGIATLGVPDSAGVPPGTTQDTIVVPYNNLDAVEQTIRAIADEVACIIVEPIAGNMGVVVPKSGYLSGLRALCDKYGALLIFDEVITGFRVAYGGTQALLGVTPDLTTLGKIIGGGLPVGAYGGRREIMECVAPAGSVYQAGTLSGNPIAVSAGIATLKRLQTTGFYEELGLKAKALADGLMEAARQADISVQGNRVESMMTLFFTNVPVIDYASAKTSDTNIYARYFMQMLQRGVYLAPSQFEAAFVSAAHSMDDIEATIAAAAESMRSL
ncbi:MAG: glutamate-1-semialdehyde 2,1-aminomutase, partial [Armatimonadetes bacterium]|nr:glutamate-1-semialdehyde 2,1-aminomutase [Armatimonadota bacterium]